MALATDVLLLGVNNLSAARYGAGMGVRMLGFVLDPAHADHLPPKACREISEWVSGVDFVLEVGGLSPAEVAAQLPEYTADFLLVGTEHPLAEWQALGLRLIVRTEEAHRLTASGTAYGLLPLDQALAPHRASCPVPCLAEGTPLPDQLPALLAADIAGLALRSGPESRPGFADFDALADLLEALETED